MRWREKWHLLSGLIMEMIEEEKEQFGNIHNYI